MAIYTFECQECQAQFEAKMSMSTAEEEKPACVKCGSARTLRVFTPIAVLAGQKGISEPFAAKSGGACMPGGCGCFPGAN